MYFQSFAAGTIPLLLLLCADCNGARQWDYEPLSMIGNTSDRSKMYIDAKVGREKRGQFTITATFGFNYDMDNETLVEAIVFRSQSGSDGDYQLVPWTIPLQPFTQYITDYYNDLIYPNFGPCSNLPKPGDENPWPRLILKMEQCVATGDGMPEIAPEGYYKVIFTAIGPVEWGFVLIVKITSKNNMMGY